MTKKARAIANCICERCGKDFIRVNYCRNRSDADSWKEYAEYHYKVCPDCWKAEKDKEEEAKAQKELAAGTKKAVRVSYSVYKNHFFNYRTVKDSYDKETKTIEVIMDSDTAHIFKTLKKTPLELLREEKAKEEEAKAEAAKITAYLYKVVKSDSTDMYFCSDKAFRADDKYILKTGTVRKFSFFINQSNKALIESCVLQKTCNVHNEMVFAEIENGEEIENNLNEINRILLLERDAWRVRAKVKRAEHEIQENIRKRGI